VADRWHLLGNLSDAMQGFFGTFQPLLKSLTNKPEAEAQASGSQSEPIRLSHRNDKALGGEELSLAPGAGRALSPDPQFGSEKG